MTLIFLSVFAAKQEKSHFRIQMFCHNQEIITTFDCLCDLNLYFFSVMSQVEIDAQTLIIAVILKSNQYEDLHYFSDQVTEKSGII